jgi:hypothetical protein
MATGTEVERAIESERDYQESLRGSLITNPEPTIGVAVTCLRHYLRLLDEAWAVNAGNEAALHVVRKVAGICFRASEQLLVKYDDSYREVPVTRAELFEATRKACESNDQNFLDLIEHGCVADFATEMNKLLDLAQAASSPKHFEATLNYVRWIGAIAFACMVKFGAPVREGF